MEPSVQVRVRIQVLVQFRFWSPSVLDICSIRVLVLVIPWLDVCLVPVLVPVPAGSGLGGAAPGCHGLLP